MKRELRQVWCNVIRSTIVSELILVWMRAKVCNHWTCNHWCKLSWKVSPLKCKIHPMVIIQSSVTILTTDLTNRSLILLKIRLRLRLWRGKLILTIVGLAKELRLTSRKLSRLTTKELAIVVTSSITTTTFVCHSFLFLCWRMIELINYHSKWGRISKIRHFLDWSFFSI